jgi:hypothetical protein
LRKGDFARGEAAFGPDEEADFGDACDAAYRGDGVLEGWT